MVAAKSRSTPTDLGSFQSVISAYGWVQALMKLLVYNLDLSASHARLYANL